MKTKFTVNRDVTTEECHWLRNDIPKGTVVFEYTGCTYGCIDSGVAVSMTGGTPFFELPYDALTKVV